MKIALVISSNRVDGFSAKLVKSITEFCAGKAEIDTIWLKDYRIDLCDADNKCQTSCCDLDDDVRLIADRLLAADSLLYVPVVHAYGTCSRMQSFIERLGYGFMRPLGRPLENKLAMVATVGRRYSHESVFSQMVLNLLLNRCIIIGSGFPANFRSSYHQPEDDTEAWASLKTGLVRMISMHDVLSNKPHFISQKYQQSEFIS